MSKELELIAHALADAADDGCFDNPPTFHEDGLPDLDVDLDEWHSGGEDRVYWMKLARASVSALAASGHTIVRTPTFDHMGPDDTVAGTCRRAARNLRTGYEVGGSNTKVGVARLLESAAAALLPSTTCSHSITMGDGSTDVCMSCGLVTAAAAAAEEDTND